MRKREKERERKRQRRRKREEEQKVESERRGSRWERGVVSPLPATVYSLLYYIPASN